MAPTIAENDVVHVDKQAYASPNDVRRWDLVLMVSPESGGLFVRRIIGLPGEKVEYGPFGPIVNGKELTLPNRLRAIYRVTNYEHEYAPQSGKLQLQDAEFFVMGDNVAIAMDSRVFGPVHFNAIRGKVFVPGKSGNLNK